MASLKLWLNHSAWWPWLAKRFFRLEEIERFVATTGERYLDADLWAGIQGISTDEAELQLQEGVRAGRLQQCFLYEWSDSPVQFIVPRDFIGRKVKLAEIGYVGEDDTRTIEISPFRVRAVFITADAE
ncbi:MAG TPA: hypothetical protein VGG72_03435 [Bryobacteraceae bacterium]|jgi:hypothetical protein